MSLSNKEPRELQAIYERRFTDNNAAYRARIWKVLVSDFFGPLVGPNATVLDLGCGYGEFINNVQCGRRYAMDLNPQSPRHLKPGVTFLAQDCSQPWAIPDASLDVVFTSNFLEHLLGRVFKIDE